MKEKIEEWSDFIKTSVGASFDISEYVVDPDHSHSYQPGKWHIYSFWLNENDTPLKIGIAGPNSKPRYMSQPYNPNSSKSNLAKSLLKEGICSENPKEWIKENTYRINVVFDNFSKPLAHALESHLHLVFNPKFEK